MRTRPYPDAAGDFSATNSLAKPLAEYHEEILYSREETAAQTVTGGEENSQDDSNPGSY
jgi:hypothetical protein